MSHATMLEMANQEHAQFGRPVAATNKSSTDVTSLWMRLPSVLYLQQPEVLSSSTVIVLALSLPLQAECDSKKSYSHCNSFLETLIRSERRQLPQDFSNLLLYLRTRRLPCDKWTGLLFLILTTSEISSTCPKGNHTFGLCDEFLVMATLVCHSECF